MTLKIMAGLVAGADLFADLDPNDLALIAGCGRNTGFDAGAYLFREGEAADEFYLIREGRVALELYAPGQGPLVLDTLDPGDVVGWSWLFPPFRWHLDARAVGPIRAVAFDGACLRGKCEADPRLGYQLVRRFAAVLQDRLQAARVRLLDLYAADGH